MKKRGGSRCDGELQHAGGGTGQQRRCAQGGGGADRLPNNMQIVSNAALALALDLARNGYDAQKASNCMRYRQAIIRKSPGYPKLAQINDMLKKIKKPDAGARQA